MHNPGYDSSDRLRQLVYPDSSALGFEYDSRGLLISIAGVLNQVSYNAKGQVQSAHLSGGVTTNYEHDARLRTSRISCRRDRDGFRFTDTRFRYDGVSNILEISDLRRQETLDILASQLGLESTQSNRLNTTRRFEYDGRYRLISETNVESRVSYSYDRIGNQISVQVVPLGSSQGREVLNAEFFSRRSNWHRSHRAGSKPGPHAAMTGTSGETLSYDANGNVTVRGGTHLAWDAKDRLSSIETAAGTTSYEYDYTNGRKHKRSNSEETLYIDQFSEIRKGRLLKFAYLGDLRVARSSSPGSWDVDRVFLHDQVESTSMLLSADASPLASFAYLPFGSVRLEASSDLPPSYLFAGKERDSESKFLYFGARYYAPEESRFLSVDPLVLEVVPEINPQRLNSYSYAENRPIILGDRSGESATVAGVLVGASVGAVARLVTGGDAADVYSAAVGGAIEGALAGLVVDTAGLVLTPALILTAAGGAAVAGGAGGFVESVSIQLINKGFVDVEKTLKDTGKGALISGVLKIAGIAVRVLAEKLTSFIFQKRITKLAEKHGWSTEETLDWFGVKTMRLRPLTKSEEVLVDVSVAIGTKQVEKGLNDKN